MDINVVRLGAVLASHERASQWQQVFIAVKQKRKLSPPKKYDQGIKMQNDGFINHLFPFIRPFQTLLSEGRYIYIYLRQG